MVLKDEILARLAQNKGEMATGGELARDFGVSRTAIWKAVSSLREAGHDIESLQGRGYRFTGESDALSGALIGSALQTRFLGRSMEVLKTTTSTSQYIKDKIAGKSAEAPEGHAVLADGQTQARGRKGRSFMSPPGGGVYLSVLFKPAIPPEDVSFLTVCAAVAVSGAIRAVFGFEPEIKWVNDIFYGGKKLCGILTEASTCAENREIESVIVGMGVNTGDVPPEVEHIATSTGAESGRRGLRNALAAEMLNRLEDVYLGFTERGERHQILAEYGRRQCVIGRRLTVVSPGAESFQATGVGIDDDARLIVRRDDGREERLNSGEVSLTMGGFAL